jgi:WD40 repeat protein
VPCSGDGIVEDRRFQRTKNQRMSRPLNLILLALLALAAPAQQSSAQTGEPPREPILRIETGMHTSVIRHLDVDHAGKFLVTASEDKTARVWELATGN